MAGLNWLAGEAVLPAIPEAPPVVSRAAVAGHHVPGTDYDWEHGWDPLTPGAAKSHYHGKIPPGWHPSHAALRQWKAHKVGSMFAAKWIADTERREPGAKPTDENLAKAFASTVRPGLAAQHYPLIRKHIREQTRALAATRPQGLADLAHDHLHGLNAVTKGDQTLLLPDRPGIVSPVLKQDATGRITTTNGEEITPAEVGDYLAAYKQHPTWLSGALVDEIHGEGPSASRRPATTHLLPPAFQASADQIVREINAHYHPGLDPHAPGLATREEVVLTTPPYRDETVGEWDKRVRADWDLQPQGVGFFDSRGQWQPQGVSAHAKAAQQRLDARERQPAARTIRAPSGHPVSETVMRELDNATTDGNNLTLPRQLDRATYLAVNKVLTAAGGKWNRKAGAHVFDRPAADVIAEIQATGRVVNRKQELGDFQTPLPVARQVIDLAQIEPGMSVLEPSAGTGTLADLAAAKHAEVRVAEMQRQYAQALAEHYPTAEGDFLAMQPSPGRQYDRIVMNPPFAPGQADIAHVRHALEFLKPDGLLVAVMAAGLTFRTNKASADFRQMVEDRGGRIVPLPEEAFASSGTDANTIAVVIPGSGDRRVSRAAVAGHHVPGTGYDWRHGWEPLTLEAARSHHHNRVPPYWHPLGAGPGQHRVSGLMKHGDWQQGHQAVSPAPVHILGGEHQRSVAVPGHGPPTGHGAYSDPWWMTNGRGGWAVSRRWRNSAQTGYDWRGGKSETFPIPATDERVLTRVDATGNPLPGQDVGGWSGDRELPALHLAAADAAAKAKATRRPYHISKSGNHWVVTSETRPWGNHFTVDPQGNWQREAGPGYRTYGGWQPNVVKMTGPPGPGDAGLLSDDHPANQANANLQRLDTELRKAEAADESAHEVYVMALRDSSGSESDSPRAQVTEKLRQEWMAAHEAVGRARMAYQAAVSKNLSNVSRAAAAGHHVPGTGYEWRHNWDPLTLAAALSHYHGHPPPGWRQPAPPAPAKPAGPRNPAGAGWIKHANWDDSTDYETGYKHSSLGMPGDFHAGVQEDWKAGGDWRHGEKEYRWSVNRQRTPWEERQPGWTPKDTHWTYDLASGIEPTMVKAKSAAMTAMKDLRAKHIAAGGDVAGEWYPGESWDFPTLRETKRAVTRAAVAGHHVPGTEYDWRHEWIPLTPHAAKAKFHGHVPAGWQPGHTRAHALLTKPGTPKPAPPMTPAERREAQQVFQVKHYIGEVTDAHGNHFTVLESGSPKHYMFAQMDPTGTYQTGLQIPVAKADLKPEIRKALSHGMSYQQAPAAPAHPPLPPVKPGKVVTFGGGTHEGVAWQHAAYGHTTGKVHALRVSYKGQTADVFPFSRSPEEVAGEFRRQVDAGKVSGEFAPRPVAPPEPAIRQPPGMPEGWRVTYHGKVTAVGQPRKTGYLAGVRDKTTHPIVVIVTDPEGTERTYDTVGEAVKASQELAGPAAPKSQARAPSSAEQITGVKGARWAVPPSAVDRLHLTDSANLRTAREALDRGDLETADAALEREAAARDAAGDVRAAQAVEHVRGRIATTQARKRRARLEQAIHGEWTIPRGPELQAKPAPQQVPKGQVVPRHPLAFGMQTWGPVPGTKDAHLMWGGPGEGLTYHVSDPGKPGSGPGQPVRHPLGRGPFQTVAEANKAAQAFVREGLKPEAPTPETGGFKDDRTPRLITEARDFAGRRDFGMARQMLKEADQAEAWAGVGVGEGGRKTIEAELAKVRQAEDAYWRKAREADQHASALHHAKTVHLAESTGLDSQMLSFGKMPFGADDDLRRQAEEALLAGDFAKVDTLLGQIQAEMSKYPGYAGGIGKVQAIRDRVAKAAARAKPTLPPLDVVKHNPDKSLDVVDHRGTRYTVSLKGGTVTVTSGSATESAPAGDNPTRTARELAGKLAGMDLGPARAAQDKRDRQRATKLAKAQQVMEQADQAHKAAQQAEQAAHEAYLAALQAATGPGGGYDPRSSAAQEAERLRLRYLDAKAQTTRAWGTYSGKLDDWIALGPPRQPATRGLAWDPAEMVMRLWDPRKHPRGPHGQFAHVAGAGTGQRPGPPGAGMPAWMADYVPEESLGNWWIPDLTPARGVKDLTSRGRPDGAGTADDPIDVQGDIDRALVLMHEGKHVRLNQVDEVATLLDRVADLSRRGEPGGWDFGLLTVAGTNLFTAQHRGIPRIRMPQFSGFAEPGSPAANLAGGAGKFADLGPELARELRAKGVGVTRARVLAAHLRATQTELAGAKVAGFASAVRKGDAKATTALNEPIFVTRDNYVVDGHHRWAANMMLDALDGVLGNDTHQNVQVIDMDIGAMIPYANEFAQRMGIAARGITRRAGEHWDASPAEQAVAAQIIRDIAATA